MLIMNDKSTKFHKKVGLVLGGGGARGLAHVGVLKVLQRERIHFDLLAGTSMGGLLGAMVAAGFSLDEIEAEILERARKRELGKLVDLRLSQSGLVKGARIYKLLAGYLGSELTFADLKKPFAVVAVDKLTGRQVVLQEGLVVDAVRATISVPGVFLPLEYKNMLLVDGGVLNNVPTDVARNMGAEFVIAVDVLPNFERNKPGQPTVEPMLNSPIVPAFFQALWEIQQIMISSMTELRLKESPPDLLIRPVISSDIDLLIGFERAVEIIESGVKATEAVLPELKIRLVR